MNPPSPRRDAESVILVDAEDRAIGVAEKLDAHRNGGRLHRAFSVFLFDDEGRMVLQQRAASKYHFPGLWTNACCGHPRPGEKTVAAAQRRVHEELGVEVALRPVFTFTYEAEDAGTGLTEREIDHVLVGRLGNEPTPDPDEVASIARWEPDALRRDIARCPHLYTPWFRMALPLLASRGLLGSDGPGPA